MHRGWVDIVQLTGTCQLALLLTHAGGDQVRGQRIWKRHSRVVALLYDKIHSNRKLIAIKLASLVDIGKVPNLSEHIFREFRVPKERNSLLA